MIRLRCCAGCVSTENTFPTSVVTIGRAIGSAPARLDRNQTEVHPTATIMGMTMPESLR
jgi:hypothetical protein